MTVEERKTGRLTDFETGWGRHHLELCDEVLNLVVQVDDLREAIAVLDLAKARFNLRATHDESLIRRLHEDVLNPVIEFFPQQLSPQTKTA